MMNGRPMRPLITQDEVDNAFATNPYKAERELKLAHIFLIEIC